MNRIDDRTVELTLPELDARERFDGLLDEGAGITEAAIIALTEMGYVYGRSRDVISPDFVQYLSEDTLRWPHRLKTTPTRWNPETRPLLP